MMGPNMAHLLHSSWWDMWDTCLPISPLCVTWQLVAGLWMLSQEGGFLTAPLQ